MFKVLLGEVLRSRRRRNAEADAQLLMERALSLRDSDIDGAIGCLERAVDMKPGNAEMHNELGVLLLAKGRLAKAEAQFLQAVNVDPGMPQPQANLGVVYSRQNLPGKAVPYLEQAMRTAPGDVTHWLNLAAALRDLSRQDAAEELLRSALERFPGHPKLEFRSAMLERELGRTDVAAARLEQLLARDPDDFAARQLLGMVCQDRGQYETARACYEAILARVPQHPHARFTRGLLALLQGDFARGWDGYEVRFLTDESPRRGFLLPDWDGSPIAGGLLMYAEQGVGDELMFASCVPDAAAFCGSGVLECDLRLAPLFTRSFPRVKVIGADRSAPPGWMTSVNDLTAQIAIGSLPRYFRRGRDAFPTRPAYLRADPDRVEYWRSRLRTIGPGPYLGISWRGGIGKTKQSVRSIPLEAWQPVLRALKGTWVCLQYDVRDGEGATGAALAGGVFATWPQTLFDLDDTAALVCALDGVVSVCTALVHLAGALGQRAWVLVPSAPEWRYGAAGDKMPWYANVRLIRQQAGDGWGPVLAAAAAQVRALQ